MATEVSSVDSSTGDRDTEGPDVLTVVSCGGSKQNIAGLERKPARELYDSTVHDCKDRYGRHSAGYYIMSARYGLIHHSKEIPYYDQTLDDMSDEAVDEWGHEVAADINTLVELHDYDGVVLIGSETYVEAILPHASQLAVPIITPWQTKNHVTGVGRGMAWCNEEEYWPCNVDWVAKIGKPRDIKTDSATESDGGQR